MLLDLTIIIANYNTRDFLRICLESIYRYTEGISYEVICVDDASSDGSARMVADLFPNVILVRNSQRQRYARSHNTATQMSLGRYACHLDSDTLLTSNAMAALVLFMDDHPDVHACSPMLLNSDRSIQHHIRGFAGAGVFLLQAVNWHKLFPDSSVMNRYYNTNFDYSRAQPVQSVATTAFVVRRSTWENVGTFDERFGQYMVDHSYCLRLLRRGFSVWYTPCTEIIHYKSRSIAQDPPASIREETEALIIFNEYYRYFRQSWISKKIVRGALWIRLYLRLAEYYLSREKSIVKGPAASRRRIVEQPSSTTESKHIASANGDPKHNRGFDL